MAPLAQIRKSVRQTPCTFTPNSSPRQNGRDTAFLVDLSPIAGCNVVESQEHVYVLFNGGRGQRLERVGSVIFRESREFVTESRESPAMCHAGVKRHGTRK